MKMIKLIIMGLFISPIFLFAQQEPKTLLWEVSKPSISFKSYLFGTFHQVNPHFFDSLVNTKNKFASSTRLFVETESTETSQPASSAKTTVYSWSKAKWDTLLTPAQKDTFAAFVSKSENDGYYSVTPVALQASLQYAYLQMFCDTDGRVDYQPMDFYIATLGRNNKMQVVELDGNQLQILDKAQKNDWLLSIGRNVNGSLSLMGMMLREDTAACSLITTYKNFELNYELDKNPTGMKVLLEDRNHQWMTVLPKAFAREQCFVAVGFRHLFYGYGLIELLRKKGFKVEPVATK
jgi:uncharacterized protein YbaP (TraB family)